ncbi:carbohydrate kinase family protein [Aeromicrobium choanae]|uniref:Sugar or nucleoside kinase, ribokinase family n=1 Tax=Aeromicrobium choanae TaxID=1736691 RepID=A0A1T4Z0X1_9ACTN|nr:sugar kinase [Aeromicrobium choanae]SKB07700.1 Sugar or nucleoside kinase, ribokinase family [Aeromicrobium choanae]
MILVVGDVVDDIGVLPLEPVAPRSDTRAQIRMTPGGSAANTAAWLGFLGSDTRFFGKVGNDGVQRHGAALREHQVEPRLVADPLLPTATIVLTLDDEADRTMYVDRAANGTLTSADLPEDLWDGVDWLHLTGYTFFDPQTRDVAIELIAEAKRRGAGVSVDPSTTAFLREVTPEAFAAWTHGVDLLVPNLDEARLLVGATGPFVDFDTLTSMYPHVVVTLGSMGAAYVAGSAREQVAAPRVQVVDTTGAGDAFTAGFLASWLETKDPRAALTGGIGAASRCVQQRGARP